MAFIGGSYMKEDNSLKLSANCNPDNSTRLATFDSLKIDFPHKELISHISIDFCAGDVAYMCVTYYNMHAKDEKDRFWSESFTIGKINLEMQSNHRIAHADCIQDYNEECRNKVLGIG